MTEALVLVSGGLDSTTCLGLVHSQAYQIHGLSFDYGQRHSYELQAAAKIASFYQLKSYRQIKLDLRSIGGSALTDDSIVVPDAGTTGIPSTYVPARNTIFLSYALAWAEVLQIQHIFIGVNAVDYSGYPDCRPEYIEAFTKMANLATKAGVDGQQLTIHTPLIDLSKRQIIELGVSLGVNYAMTVSCYQLNAQGLACGSCDSCQLRRQGFIEAGIADPTKYCQS